MLVEQAGISKAEPIHRDLGMGHNPGVAQKVFALVHCPGELPFTPCPRMGEEL